MTAPTATSFGSAAPTIRRFALIAAAVIALGILANAAKLVYQVNAPGFDGQAVRIDFTAFWAAAKLALAGQPASAFDIPTLRAAMALPSDAPQGDLMWHYPPGWHLVVTPFGLLPFSAAFVFFSALVYGAFALAFRRLAAPLPGGVALVLAAPAVLVNMNLGHNSLLWIAGLAAALAALAQGRAALAGVLIGLLTLKPQLGILIPIALAFGGHWRTVAWACVTAALVALIPTLWSGVDYWRLFLGMLRFVSELMQIDIVRFERMTTWYALARLGGAGHGLAFPLQLAVTAACAAAVAWVWSRPAAGPDIKAAALFAAIPLATPYAYHYELAHALAAALFLARDGFGATPGQRAWLAALWLGPLPGLALESIFPATVYAPPLLTATLVLCLLRATRPGGPETAPA